MAGADRALDVAVARQGVEEQDHVVLALAQRPPCLIGHPNRRGSWSTEGPTRFEQKRVIVEHVDEASTSDGVALLPSTRCGRKLTVWCSASVRRHPMTLGSSLGGAEPRIEVRQDVTDRLDPD